MNKDKPKHEPKKLSEEDIKIKELKETKKYIKKEREKHGINS